MAEYQNIIVETHGRVGLIRLNRPTALNALCDALMDELGTQLLAFDDDPGDRRHRVDRQRAGLRRRAPTSRR